MSTFLPPSSPMCQPHPPRPPRPLPSPPLTAPFPSQLTTTTTAKSTNPTAQPTDTDTDTTCPDTWTNRSGLTFSIPYPRRPRVIWDSARTPATIHVAISFAACGCKSEYKRDRKLGLPQTEPVALKARARREAGREAISADATVRGAASETEAVSAETEYGVGKDERWWDGGFGTTAEMKFNPGMHAGMNLEMLMDGDLGIDADLGLQWMDGTSVSAALAGGHVIGHSAFDCVAGQEEVSEQVRTDLTTSPDATVVLPSQSLVGAPLTGTYCFVRDGECGLCRDLVGLTSRVWDEAAAEMMADVATSLEEWEAGWLGRRIRIRGEDGYVER